jgi:transcriptional regulator with XRE-family HTH domain
MKRAKQQRGRTARRRGEKEDDRRVIGERLGRARKELGLTQAELAKQIGATLQTVKNYESGRRLPSAAFLDRLARLGINMAELVQGKGASPLLMAAHGADTLVQLDLIGSAGQRGPESRKVIDRLRQAFQIVDDVAGENDFELPRHIRDALVMAILNGMKLNALEPVLLLLKAAGSSSGSTEKKSP